MFLGRTPPPTPLSHPRSWDVLGNNPFPHPHTSPAPLSGSMSLQVGSLAGDDEKERQRERREREITGVGSMMAEGGNSIATGFKRGFTGLVNKPVQGAKQSGVGGETCRVFEL